MKKKPISLAEKFTQVSEHWSPKIIAELDDYHIKIAKFKGEFIWHMHTDADELFLVSKGNLKIYFRDFKVELAEGEMYVVPKGVEHKPAADEECSIVMIERRGTLNTGDKRNEFTKDSLDWL